MKQEERKKLESSMGPHTLREIHDLAHDFGGEMIGPTAQKEQILQDDHGRGQYEDMHGSKRSGPATIYIGDYTTNLLTPNSHV